MNQFFKKSSIFFSLIVFLSINLNAQKPSFTPFSGNVYAIPAKKATKGFIPDVLTYNIIGEVSLESLNIPDRDDEIPFPGVERDQLYGMILHAVMNISEEGCYEFVLSSDDGSIFWINDEEIVNNDGYHGMKMVIDSAYLNQGDYPVKIWYYQAFPTRYGIEFSSQKVPDSEDCLPILKPQTQIVLSGGLLFKTNSSVLNTEGIEKIDSIFQNLTVEKIAEIHIAGYTDDIGDEDYNLRLSQKRADATLSLIKSLLANENIEYFSKGYGEANPLVRNVDDDSRRKNRRVELIIKF